MRSDVVNARETSGKTRPLWYAAVDVPREVPLAGDASADVCVIGAGITGLTTAYMLAKEGKSVIVIDDGQIGSGETGRTTAHIANVLGYRYMDLVHVHGEDGARRAAESHTAAIDTVERIVQEEQIDCDFQRLDGYLFLTPGEPVSVLDDELSAVHTAGLNDIEKVSSTPLTTFDTGPALRFPRQATFHPLKYLFGLARAIEKYHGRICTRTPAVSITPGEQIQVETPKGQIRSQALVIATNAPIFDSAAIFSRQAAYRTYVIGARIPKGSVPNALYWDTGPYTKESPPISYHYVRLDHDTRTPDADMLIIGGEDHKTGQADDADERYARLETWARERFPVTSADARWSGQVMESVDGLAMIGRKPGESSDVFIATGDSGNGMTHGTIAGILLRDLIFGRENPWASLYDPSRVSLHSAKEFLRENFNVAKQLTERMRGKEIHSPQEIPEGHGAVIQEGRKKLAVYRDKQGNLHTRSAICPHKGCVVHWNGGEESWDCPCHGSRFSVDGEVLNGPTIAPLPRE